jgi:thioredoxin-related protein
MKKGLYIIYGCIFAAVMLLILFAGNIKRSRFIKEDKEIVFEDNLITSDNVLNGQYKRDEKNMILVFLSTHCEFCNEVLNSLITNSKDINNEYQLILVFSESSEMINSYVRHFQTEALQNKIIYSNSARRLNQLFKV